MLGPFATASRRTPHYHSPGVANVASHAACASMSTTTTTTTTTTTRDRGDRYGPMEWAQQPLDADLGRRKAGYKWKETGDRSAQMQTFFIC